MDHKSYVYNKSSNNDSNVAKDNVAKDNVAKDNDKKFNYKGLLNYSYNFGSSVYDKFTMPFFGSGSLSVPNLLYGIVTIMIVLFVTRSILYGDGSSVSFTSLLSYLSNYSYSVDFKPFYDALGSIQLPEILEFLKPFVSVVNAVLRVAGVLCETIINIILFIGSFISFLLG